ncbi:pentapeptide repeat-containing protein [Actinocrispum wychmicini]|uniref:Pentapeptide repeat protein n=1 Tax=Actinocrispum wychmicini TaxID=1213861 RepID=A0A4R2JZ86_9PSEU|nr:pentapeptide repeat-containing protein [Actinocrispum wychmicini]TCO65931.1 pentapeptide repeat protein [Actinocrispum wychmicini]
MVGEKDSDHRVLSTRTIVLWTIGLVLVAGLSVGLLLALLGSNDPRDAIRLDTIRTASNIVIGTGGAAALLLAARRQRSAELDLWKKDHDATERRVTELYGKAADQLGSDKAPIRLAGLYALERLAQGNPAHRQTIVNLICAYLRMPFDPPVADPGRAGNGHSPRLRSPRVDRARHPAHEGRVQELEVRQAAQTLLAGHLRPGDGASGPADVFWTDIELNLSNATLVKFALTHAVVRSAAFVHTRFVGPTTLRGTTFRANADFRTAVFVGLVDFRRVTFKGDGAAFRGTAFEGEVDFGVHTDTGLSGALTKVNGKVRRKWPTGWSERDIPDRPGWATLGFSR